jgi:hypothetical protein
VRDDLDPALHPGIDHAAMAYDPDGHGLLLYWCMDQIGWDGRPRPSRAPVERPWPDTVIADADAFRGEVFLGPLA